MIGWRRAATVAGVVAAGLAAQSCYSPYRMPSLDEPHAMVKIRIVYHDRRGPQLDQVALINGERVEIPIPPVIPGEITRAVPVRPEPLRWDLRTAFFHTVLVSQVQTYTTSESYPCGFGTTMHTCTRSTTHTRTVMVNQRVNDAACEQAAGLLPQVGGIYLMHYDFYAAGRCTLACFHQWPQPDGTFQNGPCEAPPPPPPLPPTKTWGE
jgi:hypothetical protein